MTNLPTQQEKKENFKTRETIKTRKTRGPFSSSFVSSIVSSFVSIFESIVTILFVSIFASLFAIIIANYKMSLTASIIASQLCSVFLCQEMCYSLQQDQGTLQYQPDQMILLMSLLASQKEQGITLQYVREKEEMRLSDCYLICSFGSAQIYSSPH